MPRRNRHEQYVPLDLTPEMTGPKKPEPIGRYLSPSEANHRGRMRDLEEGMKRIRQQEAALAQAGIDWSLCLVPGCGKNLVIYGRTPQSANDRDTSRHLPLCHEHGVIAWRQIQQASGLPVIIETAAEVEQRERDHWARRAEPRCIVSCDRR